MVNGCIYVVTTASYATKKLFHIGFTSNILRRLATLNNSPRSSNDICTLIKKWECDESAWHYVYKILFYHKVGCDLYLFAANLTVIASIGTLLCKYIDTAIEKINVQISEKRQELQKYENFFKHIKNGV